MKSYLTKSCLLVILSFIFFTPLNSQTVGHPGNLGPILNDHDGGGNEYLCLNKIPGLNGIFTPKLTVSIANLDLYLPVEQTEPKGGLVDYLPSDHPIMYLRFSVNGGPYVRVNLSELPFKKGVIRNGVQLYYTTIETYPIDLSNDCPAPESVNSFPIEMYLEQYVTYGDDGENGELEGYTTYPACDYTAPNEIFSCMLFLPAPYCGPPLENTNDTPSYEECHLEDMTSKIGSIYYDCDCTDDNPHDEYHEDGFINNNNGYNSNEGQVSSNPNNSILDISAMPNPFSEHLELTWSNTDDIKQISLFDTNGRLISNWLSTQLTDLSKLNIDTKSLAKGLYFIKIETADSNEVIKMVKQ